MEENIERPEDWNEDFEIVPCKLLTAEVYHNTDESHKDLTKSLWYTCRQIAIQHEPFLITNETSIDTLVKYIKLKERDKDFPEVVFYDIPKKFRSKELQEQLKKESEKELKWLLKATQKEKGKKENKKEGVPVLEKFIAIGETPNIPTIEEEALRFQSMNNFAAFDIYHCYVELERKEKYSHFKDHYDLEDFKLCFAFALRQMPKTNIREFLKYRLKKDFNSDKQEFCDFLKSVIDGYNDGTFFGLHLIHPVNNFIGEDYLKEIKSIEVRKTEEVDVIEQKDTAIRVKAIKYILQALNCSVKKDEQIKFVRYLLGKKEPEKVEGSNEDKAFQDNEKKSKAGKIKDLERVIELLITLNLPEPLKLARMDLDRLKK